MRSAPITTADAKAQAAPQLTVAANPAYVDEPVAVRLSGVRAGVKVTLRASVSDDADHRWESSGVFVAARGGLVDTAVQDSIGGSYCGVDAGGMFWSMRVDAHTGMERATFCKETSEPDGVAFVADTADGQIACAILERRWTAPNTEVRELRTEGMVGRLYVPPHCSRLPVVVVLGGSGGGFDLDKAAVLSRHGFAALALAYFGMPPLPQWLHRVPVEYFDRALAWLDAQMDIDSRRLGLLGVSRGAELALLLSSRQPQIRAVVAYAPSAIAWGSGGRDRTTGELIPCWTCDDEAIPFAPLPLRGFAARSVIPVGLFRRPVKFRNLFRAALRNRKAVERAMIPLEQTRGPILLISGGDDQVWPAAQMAETIVARLRSHGFAHAVEHVHYPKAGHSLRYPALPTTARASRSRGMTFPISFGGKAAADARAQEDAWRRSLAFLRQNL